MNANRHKTKTTQWCRCHDERVSKKELWSCNDKRICSSSRQGLSGIAQDNDLLYTLLETNSNRAEMDGRDGTPITRFCHLVARNALSWVDSRNMTSAWFHRLPVSESIYSFLPYFGTSCHWFTGFSHGLTFNKLTRLALDFVQSSSSILFSWELN